MARSCDLRLLDVIQAVSEVAKSDQETLATMVHLISSGQVKLSDNTLRAMRHFMASVNTAA
jgi:hypothetical protein